MNIKKHIIILVFVFFSILIFIKSGEAQTCSLDNCSIDAALVFNSGSSIAYSFYGHSPKIPEPINQPLTYEWWTPQGAPYATIPSPIPPAFLPPSVAFERSTGYPAVVWYASNSPFTGFIYYSRWNGVNWSTPEIVYSNTPIEHLVPVIAIDVNDTVLVSWLEISDSSTTRILSKYKTSSGWSFLQVVDTLLGNSFPYRYTSIDMAFTSNITSGLTIHDVYLVWQKNIGPFTVNCPGPPLYTTQVNHFKAFYSYWDGSQWGPATEIAGQPSPNPTSIPYNVAVYSDIAISSDKSGSVTAVWSVLQDSDPCVFGNTQKIWTSTKPAGSSSWQNTQILTDGSDPAIAFTPEDVGIVVYTNPTSSGILYALKVNGTWTSIDSPYGSCGSSTNYNPKIASMHKDKTMVVWQGSQVCSKVINTNSFSTEPNLPSFLGSRSDIAAHTGSPQNPHAEWTYLLYQASDNDLDPDLENDRAEMRQVGSTNLVNAVALTDRNITSPDPLTKIRYIKKNSETVALDMGERNSGDEKTLEDFMAFALENYPSKRTILDLSNHGNGWRGTCIDDTSAGDMLNYTEIKNALTDINNVFNLNVFSSCLMAQLEIAHLMKDYGKYMVASEEAMDAPGLPYDKILSNVTKDPFISDSKYASNFVNIFKDFYNTPVFSGADTLSAIDLSKIQALTNSVNTFAVALIINSANYSDEIKNAKNNSQEFPHPVIFGPSPEIGYRDLGHFAKLIKETVNNTSVQLAAFDVTNKVNESVINNWAGPEHAPNATGLSIYLPQHKSDYDNNFNLTNFYAQTTWDEFITEQQHDYRILIDLIINPAANFLVNSAQGIIGLSVLGNRRCSSSCGTTMPDTMCLESQSGYAMAFPIVDSFDYLINGSSLQSLSNYTLNIKLIVNDLLTHQENITGTINPGQLISGQFYSVPTINVQGTPSLGSTINFSLTDSTHPNTLYILALALSTSPGIVLPDGRIINLTFDDLLLLSIQNPSAINLNNNIGVLNSQGQETASMTIPNISGISGLTFYAAFVTLNATGVDLISSAINVTIQ